MTRPILSIPVMPLRARRARRGDRARLAALGALTALAWSCLVGAAPMPASLAEFKHTAWPMERGAPSRINSISQTRDGFLWIGSVEGLFRFDGVSFEPIGLADAEPAQRLVVSSLRAARSGELWVGLARGRGVAVLREGRLLDARMPHPSREVNDIEEDDQGGIWIARGGRSTLGLARFHAGAWREFGPDDGLPAQPVWDLHLARDGSMWVALSQALAVLRPGQTRFTVTQDRLEPRASLSEDAQGRLWISDAQGTRRLAAADRQDAVIPHPGPVGGTRLLFDRQGDLWTTTWNSGLLRIRAPGQALPATGAGKDRVASLDAADGLTSDQTRALFQDREGSLWVGTELGLDQLRPASVVVEPGLPNNSPTSYRLAAARDGTVYVADAQALYAIAPGADPRRVRVNGSPAEALCAARAGGVWLFLADRVLRVDARGAERFAKPAGTMAYGCAEDAEHRLWMPALDRGLYGMKDGTWSRWREAEPSPSLPANAVLDDRGRAVILFRAAPPAGELPFLALDASRSPAGGIEGLLPTNAGIAVSGSRGLALVEPVSAEGASAASSALLSSDAAPWAASINGWAQSVNGEAWAIGDAGIVRLRAGELESALAGGSAPKARVYGFQDGLNSFVQKAPGAQVAVGGDGRVWFLTRRNVVRMDPATLADNALPPPVLVRSVVAGDHEIDAGPSVVLPAGTTTVRVAFTALSLAVPSRVRFSHRLVGVDEAWSAPSPQRSVVLSDLRPGDYRFEVRATNNDGLWSAQPAVMSVSIPTTLTQSWPFKLAMGAAGLLVIYGLSMLRMRQVLARVRERDAERASERERIARDMHDTLLQSVQGLILHFQAAANKLRGQNGQRSEGGESGTRGELDSVLERAEDVLSEGRDRLQGLRRTRTGELEFEARRLLQQQPFTDRTRVGVVSEGTPRRVRADVFDELSFIVGEALFNAARHAEATEVAVHLSYGRRWLGIEVKDNGVGLRPEKLSRAQASGHFGMRAMRERARSIGAQFAVTDLPGQGTCVSLRIRAGIAYASGGGVSASEGAEGAVSV